MLGESDECKVKDGSSRQWDSVIVTSVTGYLPIRKGAANLGHFDIKNSSVLARCHDRVLVPGGGRVPPTNRIARLERRCA
jgi:hypothetical protein